MDHMAKEPFELAWWPLALLAAGIANSAGGDGGSSGAFIPPGLFDAAVLAAVAGGYLHYVLCVISETCAHLGIRCLSITPVGGAAKKGRVVAKKAAPVASPRRTPAAARAAVPRSPPPADAAAATGTRRPSRART